MPQDDHSSFSSRSVSFASRGDRQSRGASALAENAVSLLSKRQGTTAAGARQFILDHLLRAVTASGEFDPGRMLDELRGHRLSMDSVIDIYVPTIARLLGEMWEDNLLDFAEVTVGAMRLQSLLSIASAETLDFLRPVDNAHYMLIIVPQGEQHFLGAFVLAAQLRRLGARVEISFGECAQDLVSRVICDKPDMLLFSASSRASLETVSQLVLDITRVVDDCPITALGGGATRFLTQSGKESGIDLVTSTAKEALSYVGKSKGRLSDQAGK